MTTSEAAFVPSLSRRLFAEFLGTAMLVTTVVGSGIAAERLSPEDVGLQLLENSLATTLGLAVLITVLAPVSGAHFNPVVSLADWYLGRHHRHGPTLGAVAGYIGGQLAGGIAGAVLANLMFEVPTTLSDKARDGTGIFVAEIVATAGLVAVIFSLVRAGRSSWAGPAVGAYIGAAYWFTSSTSFANPAVTLGRVFSDTFAGIAPASVLPFILAQSLGAVAGTAVVIVLFRTRSRRTTAA
jgi:glycerol uptake facilitator-like aquaporin